MMAATSLRLPTRSIEFPRRPLLMGIVNINDDSFSGDGTLNISDAIAIARNHILAGADIIDVGAESARTNRAAIDVQAEIDRFHFFLIRWQEVWQDLQPRDDQQVWPPILSANTWRPEVVSAILATHPVEIINDMGGLPDVSNAYLCARHHAALLIMHSVGEPKIPHFNQQWPDVMAAMLSFFNEKIQLAHQAGLHPDAILIDPGIDFAKQRHDNLTIYRHLDQLHLLKRPILIPVSRKTVIGEVLNLPNPSDRDAGTIACISSSMLRDGHIFRVHHVDAAWQAVKTIHALR